MDLTAKLPALTAQTDTPGELVLPSGARRLLDRPLTLLGSLSTCEVRLQREGIAPLHCAFVQDAGGPFLRDLDSPTGTFVNGNRIQTHRLAGGDVIEVGGLRLEVHLGTPPTAEGLSADAVLLERERDAVRVQVAAVVAQQAALTEEESLLEQRATTLEKHQTQLSGLLDDRQQQLDQQHEQFEKERDGFESRTASTREELRQREQAVTQDRAALDRERGEFQTYRQRLVDLRRKLANRYRQQQQRQEAELARRSSELGAAQDRLQRERAAVVAFQERLNGELELGRRQLREQQQQLAAQRLSMQELAQQERAEREKQKADLDLQLASLEQVRLQLAEEQKLWQAQQATSVRELEGLETRIRHQRALLEELKRDAAIKPRPLVRSADAIIPETPAIELSSPQPGSAGWPAHLRDLAGKLHDQRAHLTEQWQRLLEVHQRWQADRQQALAELEVVADGLARREEAIHATEVRLRETETSLAQQREQLSASRGSLEAWHARLMLQEQTVQAQRDRTLNEVIERERRLEQRRLVFDEVEARRASRRKEEVTLLRDLRARCEEARRQYSRLWQECEQVRAAFAEHARTLEARELALDRLRHEFVASSPDSARAEARLDREERRDRGLFSAEKKTLERQRQQLLAERAALDEDHQRLGHLEATWLARHEELTSLQEVWERRREQMSEEEENRAGEIRQLRARQALEERQMRALREELERLVRSLLEDAEPAPRAA